MYNINMKSLKKSIRDYVLLFDQRMENYFSILGSDLLDPCRSYSAMMHLFDKNEIADGIDDAVSDQELDFDDALEGRLKCVNSNLY